MVKDPTLCLRKKLRDLTRFRWPNGASCREAGLLSPLRVSQQHIQGSLAIYDIAFSACSALRCSITSDGRLHERAPKARCFVALSTADME